MSLMGYPTYVDTQGGRSRDLGASRMTTGNDRPIDRDILAIQQENQRWRQRFAQAPIGMAIAGLDGRYISVNDALAEMLGRSKEDLPGVRIEHVTHPEDRERDAVQMKHALEGMTECVRIDKRYVRPDGEIVWAAVTASISRDSAGRPTQLFSQSVDLTERVRAEAALANLALHDPLTGLANRRLFIDRTQQALDGLDRKASLLAVLFLDLDKFKAINDSYGHSAGDQALVSAASAISRAVRTTDTLGRFGGDEFTVLCEQLANTGEASELARRIGSELSSAPFISCGDVALTASIGIACTRRADANPETLLREADAAMYRAKRSGPGSYALLQTTEQGV